MTVPRFDVTALAGHGQRGPRRRSRATDTVPSRRCGTTVLRGLGRCLSLCGCLVLATACDGYPKEDVPYVSPSDMTLAQLMASLNALADRPGQVLRSYRLRGACELEVAVHGSFGVRDRTAVPLAGGDIAARTLEKGQSYDVQLLPKDSATHVPLTLLEGVGWADWVQFRTLLHQVQRHCIAAQKTDVHGSVTTS